MAIQTQVNETISSSFPLFEMLENGSWLGIYP